MVVFCCNGCGESVKKQAVEKHSFRCRKAGSWDCVDCHKTFTGESYMAHTSCVTEAEKYGGKNYEHKVPKGQAKQETWVTKVHSAIEQCSPNDHKLRDVLSRLSSYSNIPRKQKPFVNFLKNSFNLSRTPEVADRAWQLISSATSSSAEAQSDTSNKRKPSEEATEAPAAKRAAPEPDVADEQENSETSAATPTASAGHKFKWKSTVKALLAAQPEGRMKLKKCHKAAIKAYRAAHADCELSDEQLRQTITQKLEAAKNICVEGKIVRLNE